jgi:hypothetical protein
LKHVEHDQQVALFTWARYNESLYPQLRAMFAIPNSARRSPRQGAWMKAEGLRAGVWDIFLPCPVQSWAGLFLEMKSGKNNLTPAQEEFRELLKNKYAFAVCYSWDAAKDEIIKYLAGERF